jgi:signal transduction histidine kinase
MQNGQPTIRLKLTLLYGSLFVLTGFFLLGTTYGLLRRDLNGSIRPGLVTRIIDPIGNSTQNTEISGAPGTTVTESVVRRQEQKRTLRQLVRQSFFALVVMTGIALGLGWWIAGRVLDPIRQITEHARSASASTLSDRIALEGPHDELKELANTIDSMLDRLQSAFVAQQSFAAQASHELRTPLSIIRAQAELTLADRNADATSRDGAAAILTAALRSEHLIDGLLALARSESSVFATETVDLAGITGDVVGEFVSNATAARIRLDLELETANIHGDPVLLRQMIGNLIQNGIGYNQPGGFVLARIERTEQVVSLIVTNSGPPVTPDELANLFQPFVRGSWARSNRNGYGLGLAIVRSVVQTHHGTIDAIARPGGGLQITIHLPSA